MNPKAQRKNIVMISFVFPPFNYSGTERPFQFARYLSHFGFNTNIISQKNFINYNCVENDFKSLEQLDHQTKLFRPRTLKSIFLENTFFDWIDNLMYKITTKKKIVTRLLQMPGQLIFRDKEWEFQVFCLMLYLKLTKRIKIIYATGPNWRNLIIGYKVSKLLRIPFVVDMRDPWTYGVLWNPQNTKEANNEIKTEQAVLKHASKVIFTSPLTEKIMISKYPFLKNKTITITNGFDVNITDIKKINNTDRFVISYTGRLSIGIRDPFVFLEGFSMACENENFRNDVLMQFVGYIDDFKNEIITHNKYNNIIIKSVVSRVESINIMLNSDVLLLIQTIKGEGNDVISGKLYEYLNVKKPILAVVPHDGGDAWLLEETKSGIITGIEDANLIKESLLKLWHEWKNGILENNNQMRLENFSRLNLTKRLADIFNEIH